MIHKILYIISFLYFLRSNNRAYFINNVSKNKKYIIFEYEFFFDNINYSKIT